ncbi:MAG: GPW/gp25 family protein [Gemmatimonadales bacterium]
MKPEKAFLGIGWHFPFDLAEDGSVRVAVYEEDVRQAICIILGTNRGERLMRPDFGAGLQDFVFAPVSTTTARQIETRVRESLIDWEPRIDVESVAVAEAEPERNRFDIHVSYRVRATNTLHNLVYPFYLEERAA